MKFYCLEEPEYRSDYKYTWINGCVGGGVSMPGFECPVCGRTGGWVARIMPYRLPDALEAELRKVRVRPVPAADNKALSDRIESGLRETYPDLPDQPIWGIFPPLSWEVPSRPEGDFFWGGGPVLSARLARAIEQNDVSGCDLIPIDTVKIGKGASSDEAPKPSSGEPEDLLRRANRGLSDGERYFVMSIRSEGHLNARMRPRPACKGCGYVEFKRGSVWKDWEIWEDSIWPGTDIFHFPTTRWIVVTERIAQVLSDLNVDNVVLRPLAEGTLVCEPEFREYSRYGLGRWIPDWVHRLLLRMMGLD